MFSPNVKGIFTKFWGPLKAAGVCESRNCMCFGETGTLAGESQDFHWEGGVSRSESDELITCGNHTLKCEAVEVETKECF